MCLALITETIAPPDMTERYVWKLFCKCADHLRDCHYDLDGTLSAARAEVKPDPSTPWPRNEWLKACATNTVCEDSHDAYSTGFHCYRTRSAARIVKAAFPSER